MTEVKVELKLAIDDHDLDRVREHFDKSDLDCNKYLGNENLLHFAARWGTLEIVQFLVKNGADINQPSGTFAAPALTYASAKGKLDIVRYLVESGSDLCISSSMANPLLISAERGHPDVVKYLISAGVDPHITFRIPPGTLVNAMTMAERGGNAEVIEILKSHGCHIPVEGVDIPIEEYEEETDETDANVIDRGQEIIKFMEQRFGPVDADGMQEIIPVMEGISVTINVIRPNEFHPYLVLFTNGMSNLPMTVPAGQEAWRYAELVMHLPPDWVHPRDADSDPRWMWPIKWLRQMAYHPHGSETWLGLPAALVSSDDPPVPLGPGTEQSCLLMIPDFSNLDPALERSDGNLVHFYTVVPLYTEERDYELENGMVAFINRFSDRQVPITVDVDRPSMV